MNPNDENFLFEMKSNFVLEWNKKYFNYYYVNSANIDDGTVGTHTGDGTIGTDTDNNAEKVRIGDEIIVLIEFIRMWWW